KTISKRIRGLGAVDRGDWDVHEYDLSSTTRYSMIQELDRYQGDKFGPLVVCEYTGLLWR
ncbi:MAG: hypothetical protein J2P54_22830, partial [Bradyrhizobiaceae bacterium]|nr:hypothetical protein [Bradyrhizobiaceae bacterium]